MMKACETKFDLNLLPDAFACTSHTVCVVHFEREVIKKRYSVVNQGVSSSLT